MLANNVTDWLEDDNELSELEEPLESDLENNKGSEEEVGSKSRSLVIDIIKMVLALLLILALIYLLLYFLNKRTKLMQQVRSLENLGGISVGQNKSLQIVRVGTRIFLIGVGDNVELLHEIVDQDVREEVLHKSSPANSQTSNFFTDLFDRKYRAENSTKDVAEKKFNQYFSKELEELKQTRKDIIGQHVQKEDTYE